MAAMRIGMIVPSLNTIAEDDLRRFCPRDIAYHVHRIQLRKDPGPVTMGDLARSYGEAEDEGRLLADMRPAAIAFNCTGVSVVNGKSSDSSLAERMSSLLGIPTINTMVAIKGALGALGIRSMVHVCPFADEFGEIEKNSLEEVGFKVVKSVGLGFKDARGAAEMPPARIVDIAKANDCDGADGILLSCANVRALEAVEAIEDSVGKPVVTSNQAMLWATARLAGWQGTIENSGRLMKY